MKIYVGNLPFSATEAQVRDLFAQHGAVESVALPADREGTRCRAFELLPILKRKWDNSSRTMPACVQMVRKMEPLICE